MDPNEEFVVLDEEAAAARNLAVDRLSVLIDLFSKALDSVNQSNILLKDELRSALTVTLQHVVPDDSTLIEDLVKKLDGVTLSTEEVRNSYVKRLCSRLVVVNEEKQALESENHSLRESLEQKEQQCMALQASMTDAAQIVRDIETVLLKMNCKTSDSPTQAEVVNATLCTSLTSIRDQLSALSTASRTPSTAGPTAMGEQIVSQKTTSDVHQSIADDIAFPELSHMRHRDSYETANSTDIQESPSDGQTEITFTETVRPENPSFGPNEEDPWCPCCTVRFASREELETHLQSCLQ